MAGVRQSGADLRFCDTRDARGVQFRHEHACPELELLHRPELNIVCFRYRGVPPWPEWIDDDSPLDRINTRIQERIEESGVAWLSLPHYRRRTILRAVILHPRSDEALLDKILDEVRAAGRELGRRA